MKKHRFFFLFLFFCSKIELQIVSNVFAAENGRQKRELTDDGQGFILGTDESCDEALVNKYCNGPLKPDTAYRY